MASPEQVPLPESQVTKLDSVPADVVRAGLEVDPEIGNVGWPNQEAQSAELAEIESAEADVAEAA